MAGKLLQDAAGVLQNGAGAGAAAGGRVWQARWPLPTTVCRPESHPVAHASRARVRAKPDRLRRSCSRSRDPRTRPHTRRGARPLLDAGRVKILAASLLSCSLLACTVGDAPDGGGTAGSSLSSADT